VLLALRRRASQSAWSRRMHAAFDSSSAASGGPPSFHERTDSRRRAQGSGAGKNRPLVDGIFPPPTRAAQKAERRQIKPAVFRLAPRFFLTRNQFCEKDAVSVGPHDENLIQFGQTDGGFGFLSIASTLKAGLFAFSGLVSCAEPSPEFNQRADRYRVTCTTSPARAILDFDRLAQEFAQRKLFFICQTVAQKSSLSSESLPKDEKDRHSNLIHAARARRYGKAAEYARHYKSFARPLEGSYSDEVGRVFLDGSEEER